MFVQDQSPARLFDILAKDKSTDDIAVSWLNPQTSKRIVVKNAPHVMDEIANLKP